MKFKHSILMKKGDDKCLENKLDEAIVYYDKIIADDKYAVNAYIAKGSCYEMLNLYSVAIDNYINALMIQSNNYNLCNNIGNLLHKLEKNEEAITYFKQAINIKENYPFAWVGLGYSKLVLGHPRDALEAFEMALNINPNLKNAQLGKSRCNILLSGNSL